MVGGDCGFTRTGFLQLVGEEYQKQMLDNISMHQKIGIPAFTVDANDVKRLAPSFYTENLHLISYEPESGYADPSAAAASFMGFYKEERYSRLKQGFQVTGIPDICRGRVN